MPRRDLAVHRVLPADQGLGAALLLGGEVVLRLIDDLELLASQCQAQLVLDQAAALQRLVHALLEEAHALTAVAFGAGESNAGMAEHGGRGVAISRGQGDTDAGGDQHFLVCHLQRAPQGFDQAVHEGHDVAEIGDVDEGDGELVAAEPGDQVALAERRLNAGADVAQHLVAAGVIGGVVDLLELVDVEAEDGDMAAIAMHAIDGRGQALAERLAIGKAGEGVVLLEIADLLFGLAPFPSAHPGKRGRHGDAGAKQEQGDGGDQSEIAGQHVGLVALVEIDHQRAVRTAVQGEGEGERGEMRLGSCRRSSDRA